MNSLTQQQQSKEQQQQRVAYKSNVKLLTLSRRGAMKALPSTSGPTVSDNKRHDTHKHTHTHTHTYSQQELEFMICHYIGVVFLENLWESARCAALPCQINNNKFCAFYAIPVVWFIPHLSAAFLMTVSTFL